MSNAPDWRLRARRRIRRLPPVRAWSIVRQVVRHPSNAGHRSAAVRRAIAWQWRSRRSETPVPLRVYGDLTLLAYPRSNSASNAIYFTPYFDPHEMAFVERVLLPGDCFVDCGANIGTYTLLAANAVGPTGRVVRFEPSSKAYSRLVENVEVNGLGGCVIARHAAVGAGPGTVNLSVGSDVSNTVIGAGEGGGAVESVPVVTVDDEVLEQSPCLVKIDVEGFELEALKGMTALLGTARPPHVLIELTPHLLLRAGTSATAVAQFLSDRGYQLMIPTGSDGSVTPADIEAVEHRQRNYVCVHRSRWHEIATAGAR